MIKNVLITGADKGLGFSLVQQFLHAGVDVFAGWYHSNSEVLGLVKFYPQILTPIALDVTRLDSVHKAVDSVAKLTSALDVLINNAGVMLETRTPLLELDLASLPLHETFDVNTFGPLRVVQQFLPMLEKGDHKLIINISSEAGSISDCWRESEFAYSMSKAALNMQSKILQNHLKPRGFKILAVHPGWMRTDMGGSEADINADEAAEGIFKLAMKKWNLDDDVYMDYKEQPISW